MYGGVTASGRKTATAQISVIPGLLHSVVVEKPSTGTALLIIYDSENTSTSGKLELLRMDIDSDATADTLPALSNSLVVNRGIYAVLSGSDAGFNVHYSVM